MLCQNNKKSNNIWQKSFNLKWKKLNNWIRVEEEKGDLLGSICSLEVCVDRLRKSHSQRYSVCHSDGEWARPARWPHWNGRRVPLYSPTWVHTVQPKWAVPTCRASWHLHISDTIQSFTHSKGNKKWLISIYAHRVFSLRKSQYKTNTKENDKLFETWSNICNQYKLAAYIWIITKKLTWGSIPREGGLCGTGGTTPFSAGWLDSLVSTTHRPSL